MQLTADPAGPVLMSGNKKSNKKSKKIKTKYTFMWWFESLYRYRVNSQFMTLALHQTQYIWFKYSRHMQAYWTYDKLPNVTSRIVNFH